MTDIEGSIKEQAESLERNGFIGVPLNLSEDDMELLDRVKITHNLREFDHYGFPNWELTNNLEDYFLGMGDNPKLDCADLSKIVTRIALGTVRGFDAECAWTCVRVCLSTTGFSTPRWHQDGSYFESERRVYKLVATLKGARTLFGQATDMELFQRAQNIRFSDSILRIRRLQDRIIKPIDIPGNDAVAFLVGDENGVIHSEPDITSPRIFVSVLPGSKSQIEHWSCTGLE